MKFWNWDHAMIRIGVLIKINWFNTWEGGSKWLLNYTDARIRCIVYYCNLCLAVYLFGHQYILKIITVCYIISAIVAPWATFWGLSGHRKLPVGRCLETFDVGACALDRKVSPSFNIITCSLCIFIQGFSWSQLRSWPKVETRLPRLWSRGSSCR